MAVEAHHLHLFSPQLIKNRDVLKLLESQSMGYVNPNMAAGSFVPVYNPVSSPSESGITVNKLLCKRQRTTTETLSFLGEDISPHLNQQMVDFQRLFFHHAGKVTTEISEKQNRFVAAIEERVSKRLKAKEEEIERIARLNWALEERLKSLATENQVWRYLAQTNEATANELRSNLEQVLAEQIRVKEEQQNVDVADDAESFCCGDNLDGIGRMATTVTMRMCCGCGDKEPSVLLLPCRHLCLCAACSPAINTCPVCKCSKTGSVNVNLA